MTIRVRLGNGVARLAPAPLFMLELDPGATVGDALHRIADAHPDLGAALPGTLAVVGGVHAGRAQPLRAGDELALLMPLPGG